VPDEMHPVHHAQISINHEIASLYHDQAQELNVVKPQSLFHRKPRAEFNSCCTTYVIVHRSWYSNYHQWGRLEHLHVRKLGAKTRLVQ
jgi:hypothetical protein